MSKLSVQDYFDRSGDTSLCQGNVEVAQGKGFCIWDSTETNLILLQVYGDGTYWNSWATEKAKELGKIKISFGTKRNPKSFRKHGFTLVGYILERDV